MLVATVGGYRGYNAKELDSNIVLQVIAICKMPLLNL
jgi:hypothetical protein